MKRLVLALTLAAPAWAGYQYYLTDNLSAIDNSKWALTGSLAPASGGLAAANAAGGSLISRIPIPDLTSEAEVRTVITLKSSGGTYTEFLQASQDAKTSGSGSGTYLAFEMQNPTFDSAGRCSANFVLLQAVSGSVSLIASFPHSCRDGMVMRMAVHNGVALVWPDQDDLMEFAVGASGAGQPGIGAHSTPAGNAISQVQLGAIDRNIPAVPDMVHVRASAFRNHVDVQWKAIALPPAATALAGYWVYRDGKYLLRTSRTSFSDETVVAGAKYTYTIYSVTDHYTFSPPATVSVSIPNAKLTQVGPLPVPTPSAGPAATAKAERAVAQAVQAGTPQADSGGGLDPRRTGVRPLGSYWGSAGEQIDVVSGNMNFTLPLLKPQSRGGWGLTFALSYNSQMWRNDGGGAWLLGQDVGYGLGWKFQAGSITPVWNSSGQIDHYLFADSTGAEYSLNLNNGGVWTSQEGVYVSYDSNANILYFTDGSYWVMGCQSAGGEQDAGTLYPTIIEDTNGNQISLTYLPGNGSGAANTSARLQSINDPRGPQVWSSLWYSPQTVTYAFTYNSDPIPHLIQVSGPKGETFTFSYLEGQPLSSPFDGSSFGSTVFLQSAEQTGLGVSNTFQYSGYGEMSQYTTPLGGSLQWQYRTFTYATGVSLREVQGRSAIWQAGAAPQSHSFYHDDAETVAYSLPIHYWTAVYDWGANSWKFWAFNLAAPSFPQALGYWENASLAPPNQPQIGNWSALLYKSYLWTQDAAGNTYLAQTVTYHDPGTSNAAWFTTQQTLDTYGNIKQQQLYDYNGSLIRTYNFTYLHESDGNYAARHILNRLTQATVTAPGGNAVLASYIYDRYTPAPPYPDNSYLGPLKDGDNVLGGVGLHDAANYGVNFTYRGNPTSSYRNGNATVTAYLTTGIPYQIKGADGVTADVSTDASTAYSLPSALTPNSNGNLATNLAYAANFAPTSVIGPNGVNQTVNYDNYNRVTSTKSIDGATTNYTYTYVPNTQTATISTTANNTTTTQWKRTTFDGFGRTIKVETGHDNTTVSIVDTQYGPCACSPLGKVVAVSEPYGPGETEVWTRYTYDASGRTLTVTKPDGSVTTTSYQTNNTTVTDPAGKWKTFTSDAAGNLTQVTEPDPANGSNRLYTYYTYNGANQLTQVSMPRSNGTQTRTFQWSGTDLVSATNPENGTVTYQYDGYHHVKLRTDAIGQQTQYFYDAYNRLTEVHHYAYFYPCGTPSPTCPPYLVDQPDQTVYYYYDSNPLDPGYSQNAWGRLAAVQFHPSGVAFAYQYSYNQAGRVTGQRLISFNAQNQVLGDIQASYTWDNQGRMTGLTYPWDALPADGGSPQNSPSLSYTYDATGRLTGMSGVNFPGYSEPISASGAYNSAGQLTSLSWGPGVNAIMFSETRTYNSLHQLTRETTSEANYDLMSNGVYQWVWTTVKDMQYIYPSGQNNGRVSQTIDGVTGENVTYQYDALNRLISAASAGGVTWSQTYAYDGFGNLNGADPATNRAGTANGNVYDANGNYLGTYNNVQYGYANTYDVENRLVGTPGGPAWTYDPWGKRIAKNAQDLQNCEVYFYGITGQKLATFRCVQATDDFGNTIYSVQPNGYAAYNVYFGGRMLQSNGRWVVTDRLGSVRATATSTSISFVTNEAMAYFPYGVERTSTPDGREKFAGYMRDSAGQDYADQRYYSAAMGRFLTPDPLGISGADPKNPTSWNRYAYAYGDPINYRDPRGLFACNPNVCGTDDENDDLPEPHPDWPIPGPPPPPPPSTPRDKTTDGTARGILQARLKNFKGSNCDKVFSNVIDAYTTSDFVSDVNKTEFYNVTNPNFSNLTQNQVIGNGNNTSLVSSVPYGAAAVTIGDATNSAILLAANFYSNTDSTYRQNVLLHELLHAYTGWNDAEILSMFKNYGLSNPNGDTEDISAWLSTDCTKTPSSFTWWTGQ
jgi:RHS repeat-associated protein